VFGAPSCAIGLCGRLGLGLAALLALALALLALCDLLLVVLKHAAVAFLDVVLASLAMNGLAA
jgi:hypothetical protein